MVLSCTFDHRISDAYSANMFLVSWSEIAAGKSLSRLPSFCRSLLNPRHSLDLPSSSTYDSQYIPISSIRDLPTHQACYLDEVVNRIYYITAEDIQLLQSMTSGKRTKIEAVTAYLWKALAKTAGLIKDDTCRMGVVVDGRSRLADSAMNRYFGNVLSIPYGTLDVEKLMKMELEEVADEVHGWLRPAATEEHFRGLVDWVEAHRPEPAVARIYCGGGIACVVSSGRSFPVGEVEFGWGKAAFGSFHFAWGGSTGYVMPMPSAKGNGDWVVYVHVGSAVVEVLEAADPLVFRPMTAEYWNPTV